jgi:membrane-associated phospholipid phosphatase
MEKREERLYPSLIVAVTYYVMYILFNSISIPGIVTNFFLGVATLMLIVLLAGFRWKISIHMAACGGCTGAFIGIAARYELNIVWLIALFVLLSGIVGFARLKLNAHKPSEVYSGFLAGVVLMLLLYLTL